MTVAVSLTHQPHAPVYINVTSPMAWDDQPILSIRPAVHGPLVNATLTFLPSTWGVTQKLTLTPRASICEGDFYLPLLLRWAMKQLLPCLSAVS